MDLFASIFLIISLPQFGVSSTLVRELGTGPGFERHCISFQTACVPGEYSAQTSAHMNLGEGDGLFHQSGDDGCQKCPNGTVASNETNLRAFTWISDRVANKTSGGYKLLGFDYNRVSGPSKEGLNFDGVDDYVELEPWEIGGAFSIELYVRFESLGFHSRLIEFWRDESDGYIDDNGLRMITNTGGHIAGIDDGKVNKIHVETSHQKWSPKMKGYELVKKQLGVENFVELREWVQIIWAVSETGSFTLYKNGKEIGFLAEALDQKASLDFGTRARHWVGKGKNIHNSKFYGTLRSVAFYDRAIEPQDQLSATSVFRIGLNGATSIAACTSCAPVEKCSAIVCEAGTSKHRFSELGGLLCPPCAPDEAESNFVACLKCPPSSADQCGGVMLDDYDYQTSLSVPAPMLLIVFIVIGRLLLAGVRLLKRKRNKSNSVQTRNEAPSAPNPTPPKGTVALLTHRDDGNVLLWSGRLRFQDADLERQYTKHIMVTQKDSVSNFIYLTGLFVVALYSILVLWFYFIGYVWYRHEETSMQVNNRYVADSAIELSSWVCLGVLIMVTLLRIALRRVTSPRLFQVLMVCVQAGYFSAVVALPEAVSSIFIGLQMPGISQLQKDSKRFSFSYHASAGFLFTTLLLLSSSSIFKLKWSNSALSSTVFSVTYLILLGDSAYYHLEWYEFIYHYSLVISVLMFMIPVAVAMVPRFLRETDISSRTEWVSGWLKDEELRLNAIKIKDQKIEIKNTKAKLAEANLQGRLAARPPRPFSQEEFDQTYDGGNESEQAELTAAVFAICKDWALAHPFDDMKWAYLKNVLVPLGFWDSDPNFFQRLRVVAANARGSVITDLRAILSKVANDGGDGAVVCHSLEPLNGDLGVADAAGDWFPKRFLRALGDDYDDNAKNTFDIEVLPSTLRFHATNLYDGFGAAMTGGLPPGTFFYEPEEEAKTSATDAPKAWGEEEQKKIEVRRRSIASHFTPDRIMVRFGRLKCIKDAKRMGAKVLMALKENAATFPRTSTIGDSLRASMVVKSPTMLLLALESLEKSEQLRVVRVKNKFRIAYNELLAAKGKETSPTVGDDEETMTFPDLHVNVVYEPKKGLAIVAEIQLHLESVIALKKESHKLYQITRATTIDALRP